MMYKITYDIMSVYATLSQFLNEPLSFIQRQELRNTNTDKCGQGWITKLLIHLLNN